MSAPNANPFELTPPRRPGLDDFNGAVKENDTDPPDPVTMLSAEEYNTLCRLVTALGGVVPHTLVTVRFNAGQATIDRFASANGNAALETFQLARGAAPGDTSLTWPAGTFPPAIVDPMVTISEDVEVDRVRAIAIANGVRVRTLLGSAGVDARYTVAIY